MEWAELSADLLCLISKKLGDISGIILFCVVFKNWRLVIRPCNCPPQLPWLLNIEHKKSSKHQFFSLYSNKTHTLHVPQAEGKDILGATRRYIFMQDRKNSSLLFVNPLTGSDFHIRDELFSTLLTPEYIGNTSTEDCDVVIFQKDVKEGKSVILMVFLQFDGRVVTKSVEVSSPLGEVVGYYKERLFSSLVDTTVINVNNGDVEFVIRESEFELNNLVEACGEMLRVVRLFIDDEWQFEVYRLDDDGTNPHWLEMTRDIGNMMLFLGAFGNLCLKASDFDGLTDNCIYFMKWNGDHSEYVLARCDLESNKTQLLPFQPNKKGYIDSESITYKRIQAHTSANRS